MAKQIGKSLLILSVSLASGIAGGALAFFYLAGLLPFGSGDVESLAPVRITERQEVIIQENKALKDAAAKVVDIAAGIKVTKSTGAAAYGSGVIFTSDGMVAVPYSLFPPGAAAEVTARGKKAAFEVLKRDKAQNLVILKLKDPNWPTAGFYQLDNLKMGERVFLAGTLAGGGNFVNEGIVRNFTAGLITTSIYEKAEAEGSPMFDIEGNIMGIASIDKTGQVIVIPISKIRELSAL